MCLYEPKAVAKGDGHMGVKWDFWRTCAARARVGASEFANDWQWFSGVPLASALATYIVARRGSDLTTGSPIADGVLAAAAAFLITWLVAFLINLWREAPKMYLEEKKRADDAEERLRPKLDLSFVKGMVVPRPDGHRHTFINVINKSEGFIDGVLPRIIESKFKSDESNVWRNTSIVASLNLSWCSVPEAERPQKYSGRTLRPNPPELVDFVHGPHTRSKRYAREGAVFPYPEVPFFEIQIDPTHVVGGGVLPYFFKKGIYKFVIQVSASSAGHPVETTLFVEWNGEDFVIRSADNELLEPVNDEAKSLEAV